MSGVTDFMLGRRRVGTRRSGFWNRPGWSTLAGIRVWVMVTLLGILACASNSPFNQTFVEVRTPNFHVTSSFDEQSTRALARDLEVFHAGVIVALGLDPDALRSRPTQVIAFDGRGVTRPFAERGAAASLVPTIDGPILMIRAAGGFSERIDPELRHRYAHRILRDLSRAPAPLWYEEGRAQVAGTIEQSGDVVVVGRSSAKFRRAILDWRNQDLTEAMERRSFAGASERERAEFESRAWAIVHTVLFDSASKRGGVAALRAVRVAFESNAPDRLLEATRALGASPALTERIYAHLEEDRHRVDRMQVTGIVLGDLELRPVAPVLARDRLAELALSLERPGLASEYFERALRDRPDHAPSIAGLVLADAAAGRADGIDERAAEVAAVAASDAVASSRLGMALVVSAARLPAGAARKDRLLAARALLERSLRLEPGRIEAQMGLGRSFLVAGDDPTRAAEWFETVRQQSPGALEVELWLARLQLQIGRPVAARAHADEALSRSHSRSIREAAREIIDEAEARDNR